MKTLPQFESYINGSSSNYGLNSLRFWDSEGNSFYFSYETLVAFKPIGKDTVCLKNYWSTTTGKHLNVIESDHKARVDLETFKTLYQEHFGEVDLSTRW